MQASTNILQSAHHFSVGKINVDISYVHAEGTSTLAEASRVAQWLSNPKVNYWGFHNEIKSRRTEGTGLWFLEGELFRKWVAGELKVLWVTGMPGSGKTVLASTSLEHSRLPLVDGSKPPMLFVYCRYVDRCTARDILCTFLEQLVIHHRSVYTRLKPSYEEHKAKQTRLPESEALQALTDALSLFDDSFAIIDGLDEVADEEKVKLLTMMAKLPTKLLIFSRPLELFAGLLPKITTLPLKVNDEDIRHFVADRIATHPRLRRLVSQKESLTQQIVDTILQKSEGMFLIAALQVDALNGCLNMKSLMKALDSLPSGINEMYQRTMVRISDQSEEEATLGKLTLLWLTYSQRTLKVEELQDALATSFRDGSYDVDAITESDMILATCCGLVTIDASSREVRLIHHTTHEFLQSLSSSPPFSDHAVVTTLTCTIYLAHHEYPEHDLRTPDALGGFLSKGPAFIRYAQQFWAIHAQSLTRKEHADACTQVATFLNRCRPIVYSFPLLNYFNFPYRLDAEYEVLAPCHVAARFGLVELYPDVEGHHALTSRYKWNALHLAALFDQEAVAMLIFKTYPNLNLNETDERGRAALHLAAQEGNSLVIKLLLSQPTTNVNLPDKYRSVPLCLAAEEGHISALSLLVSHPSVNINALTRLGESPLLQSVQSGCLDVAEVFLNHPSVNVNIDDGRESVLLAAVRRRHVKIVEKLVGDKNLLVNWKPQARGHSALFEAISPANEQGSSPVLPILLTHPSIDVNVKDGGGHTPLTRAVNFENFHAMKLLLAHPHIDPNIKDSEGFAPLHTAISLRLEDALQLLLSHPRVDPNIKDSEGLTPLNRVINGGMEDALLCILAHPRTDPNIPFPNGYTPLLVAITRDLQGLFDVLLSHKNIDVRRLVPSLTSGRTIALIHAILRGSHRFTTALLQHYSAHYSDSIFPEGGSFPPFLLEQAIDINIIDDAELAFLAKFWPDPQPTDKLDWLMIYLRRDALSLIPAGHASRPAAVTKLALSLSSGPADHPHSMVDLDVRIPILREALLALPYQHPGRGGLLALLADSLFHRFRGRSGPPAYLDEAISVYRKALALSPNATHPDCVPILNNLAWAHKLRFTQRGDTKDQHEFESLLAQVAGLRRPRLE